MLEVSNKLAFQGSRKYFAEFQRMLEDNDGFGYRVWDFYLSSLDLTGFVPSVFPTTKAMKRQVSAHLDSLSNWWKSCLMAKQHVEPELEDIEFARACPEQEDLQIQMETPLRSKAHSKGWLLYPVHFEALYKNYLDSKHCTRPLCSQSEFTHKLRNLLPPDSPLDDSLETFRMPPYQDCLDYGKRILAMDDPPEKRRRIQVIVSNPSSLRQGLLDFAPVVQ